jgi:type II secretory pathway component PulF
MTSFRWPGFDASQRLSTEEAVELASRVAELTKAGLPLGDGLRAMADELPGRRLPRVLRALAEQLDAGVDLAAAIDAQGRRLPACLRGLVLAGIHSGRLAEVLEEYADIERGRLDLRRRLWLCLSYPLVLLAMLTGLSFLMSLYIVTEFKRIFMDFGTDLPPITQLVIHGIGPLSWFLLILVIAFFLIPFMFRLGMATRWTWPVLHRLPLLGPLLRWGQLVQFSRLMGLLLDQQVPLPDALRLAAAGLRDANLAHGCRGAADDVQSGRSLCDSLASRRQFPPSLIPVIEWGQNIPALPDAFRAAAEMFEGRVRSRGTILEVMLLPVMLLVISTFVGFVVIALFMPLISLITKLSN